MHRQLQSYRGPPRMILGMRADYAAVFKPQRKSQRYHQLIGMYGSSRAPSRHSIQHIDESGKPITKSRGACKQTVRMSS